MKFSSFHEKIKVSETLDSLLVPMREHLSFETRRAVDRAIEFIHNAEIEDSEKVDRIAGIIHGFLLGGASDEQKRADEPIKYSPVEVLKIIREHGETLAKYL